MQAFTKKNVGSGKQKYGNLLLKIKCGFKGQSKSFQLPRNISKCDTIDTRYLLTGPTKIPSRYGTTKEKRQLFSSGTFGPMRVLWIRKYPYCIFLRSGGSGKKGAGTSFNY